jgi:hypothetical protein
VPIDLQAIPQTCHFLFIEQQLASWNTHILVKIMAVEMGNQLIPSNGTRRLINLYTEVRKCIFCRITRIHLTLLQHVYLRSIAKRSICVYIYRKCLAKISFRQIYSHICSDNHTRFSPFFTEGCYRALLYPPSLPNKQFADCIWMYLYRLQINWEI